MSLTLVFEYFPILVAEVVVCRLELCYAIKSIYKAPLGAGNKFREGVLNGLPVNVEGPATDGDSRVGVKSKVYAGH